MEKQARKKSTDPIQEQLREHKDKWNIATKEFINRIIAFKRALNGRGDPKYSLPPSNIKEPLPSEIVSFLNQVTQDFQLIAEEGSRIIQEQANYSANRKQPAKTASRDYQKGLLSIKDQVIPTLLAISFEEQATGLMNQPWPPPVMSFVYNKPQSNRFWMKSTPSPLDIVFVCNGTITQIDKGEPHSTTLIGNGEPSDLVIEFPYGTCAQLNLQVGDSIKLSHSTIDYLYDKYRNPTVNF